MKDSAMEKEIERLAQRYRLRAKWSSADGKRHDVVHDDEARDMLRLKEKHGLTPSKIAVIFRRDVRTVDKALEEATRESPKAQESTGDVTRTARLQIEFDPGRISELGIIHYSESPLVRKFARISVRNVGALTAVRSWAVLRIQAANDISCRYPRDLKLHWVDAPYCLETDSVTYVDIPAGTHRLLDVVFSQPTKGEPQLPDQTLGSGLTSGRPYLVIMRSTESAELEQNVPQQGCWVANAIALANPCATAPGYMPPERYLVEVVVGCENGQGETRYFEIVSPSHWQNLEMLPAGPPQLPK